jgi:hypothetical protein
MHLRGHFGDDFRKEILVAETGRPTQHHFGDCMARAITNHFGTDPAVLNGPNTLAKPSFQRQIVGDAAEQGHGRVCVRVDQPGDQDMSRSRDDASRVNGAMRLGGRKNIDDSAVVDGNRMIRQNQTIRFNRDAPAGQNKGIALLHSGIYLRNSTAGKMSGYRRQYNLVPANN